MKKINASKKLTALNDIIRTLRAPGGCPWDREQTPQTFKSYFIEEAYEVLEAVEDNEPQQIKEELGDLFFQLLFLNQLYEDDGHFTLENVLDSIIEKMIRRHPHVFAGETVENKDEQRRKWNQIKAVEKKKHKTVADLLSGVPRSFPALRRAQRVSERAAHNGFEWQDIKQALDKLQEEVDELKKAVESAEKTEIVEELGDVLFMSVNIGRLLNINTEDTMNTATMKFIKRFTAMEKKATQSDLKISDCSSSTLLKYWKDVKAGC